MKSLSCFKIYAALSLILGTLSSFIVCDILNPLEIKPYYVYSIDSNFSVGEYSGWGTSSYTKGYAYGFNPFFNTSMGTSFNQTSKPMKVGDTVSFGLQEESFGVQAPYMSIYQNQTELQKKVDFVVIGNISTTVVPSNYFNTSSYNSGASEQGLRNASIGCLYTNPGPSYIQTELASVGIDNLVNLWYWNMGLTSGETGIRLVQIQNANSNPTYSSVEHFLAQHNSNNQYTSISNIQFTKLFLDVDVTDYTKGTFMVAALSTDSRLFVYNITDKNYSDLPISEFGVFVLDTAAEMSEFVYEDGKIVVSTKNMGMIIYTKKTDGTWDTTSITSYTPDPSVNLQIIDMVSLNNLVYIIIENYGMVTFDIVKMQFNPNHFSHPSLVQIDYTMNSNMNYIGVTVNNNPPSVPEFFIEFAHNFDSPGNPLVNKVFISEKNVPVQNIATDMMLGVTYVFDTDSNSLIMLIRGTPNSLLIYNYILNLSNLTTFTQTNLSLFLFSAYNVFYPYLVIDQNGNYYTVGQFTFPRNTLTCDIYDSGVYDIEFNAPGDCSYFDNNNDFHYTTCWVNSTFTIPIGGNGSNLTALWVILALLIVAAIVIIVVVVCCKRCNCCKSGAKSKNINYMRQPTPKEGEMEIQVTDNKL